VHFYRLRSFTRASIRFERRPRPHISYRVLVLVPILADGTGHLALNLRYPISVKMNCTSQLGESPSATLAFRTDWRNAFFTPLPRSCEAACTRSLSSCFPVALRNGKINRHTFLLEISVSYSKQSSSQNLIATRMAYFPHPRNPLLPTHQCPPRRTVFSSISFTYSASFASPPLHALNSPFRLNPRGQSCL
jgi:hypothetical protein